MSEMVIAWLRRTLHLGPDYQTIAQTQALTQETAEAVRRVRQARMALQSEIRDGPARAIRDAQRRRGEA